MITSITSRSGGKRSKMFNNSCGRVIKQPAALAYENVATLYRRCGAHKKIDDKEIRSQ